MNVSDLRRATELLKQLDQVERALELARSIFKVEGTISFSGYASTTIYSLVGMGTLSEELGIRDELRSLLVAKFSAKRDQVIDKLENLGISVDKPSETQEDAS